MGIRVRIIDIFICLIVLAIIGVLIFADISISNKNPQKSMLDNLYTMLSILTILISGCIGFWKFYLKKQVEKVKKQNALMNDLVLIFPVIKNIAEEFKPNGGNSFKDGQMRIENSISDLVYATNDIKENQKAFFDIMELPYWLSDDKGQCIYASQTLCDTMGRTLQEILGNNWVTWLHPDSKNVFDDYMDSISEKRIFKEDYTFKRRDGKWQRVSGYAQHKFNNGRYIGSVGKLSKIGEPFS